MATYNITANNLSGAGIFNIFAIPDSSAQDFINATGIADTIQQNAICDLVRDLKNYGLWSKMKAVYPFVTDNRNLLSYTEDFSNGVWGKSGATVTANDTLAPNGTMTADKIVFGAANNYIIQGYAQYNLGNCSHSIYVKGTPGETIHIDDGYIAIPNVVLTGNWQRIDWVSNRGSGQNQGIGIGTYNGATARTIYLWGAQLELGSTATTYQPIATTPQAYISSQFKFNLKDPRDLDAAYRLVFNGGWTFDKTGATPNGTNGFADTKLNASTTLSVTSLSFGGYTSSTLNALGYHGAYPPSFLMHSFKSFNFAEFYRTTASAISVSGGIVGMVQANQLGTTSKIYSNNSIGASDSVTMTSLPNVNMYIGAASNNGTGTYFDNHLISYYYYSDGLTDTEAANLYTRVQAYQTALSRQV